MKLQDCDVGLITHRVLKKGEGLVALKMNSVPPHYDTKEAGGVTWFKWQNRWWPSKFMFFLNTIGISVHDLHAKAKQNEIPKDAHVFIRNLYSDGETLQLIDFIENKIKEIEGYQAKKDEVKYKEVI